MPYPALPSARRMHYEIDGTVIGYNVQLGFSSGVVTQLTAGNMLSLNSESNHSSIMSQVTNPGNIYVFIFFPELVDLSKIMFGQAGNSAASIQSIQSSSDTTTGVDGTWNTVATSGTNTFGSAGDFWRANSPASLTSNNTNIKALRIQFGTNQPGIQNFFLWGNKHTGQTPDDIIFLESDATTEWPNDDDWGDLNAGAAAVTHTYYVKNTAPSHTANTITVKSSGSDSAQWTVSLDNVSFASSKSIASLAPGAQQVVYFKFTPPSPASGVYRPYAGYFEADVASWS